MHFSAPSWRRFDSLTSDGEASSIAAACIFSLATLEIASSPGTSCFALTERKEPEVWRWAVVSPSDFVLDEGWEATQQSARRMAAEKLWLIQESVLLEMLTAS